MHINTHFDHIGEPARPVVKVGDKVYVGTLIGEACEVISANIHSSVSGKVLAVEARPPPNGTNVMAVVIENGVLKGYKGRGKNVVIPKGVTFSVDITPKKHYICLIRKQS